MNLQQLVDEVIVVLDDDSDEIVSRIPDWINEAIATAVERAEVPGFGVLNSVDTVVGQAYTSLPSQCSRLLYVGDGDVELTIVTLEGLLERYPGMDEEGDVEVVAVDGATLYYQPIPAEAQTLTVLYRRKPATLVEPDDVPEGIPEMLHRKVIVQGAAAIGFGLIEDGIEEGKKVNTAAAMMQFEQGLHELQAWVERRRVHRPRSIWRY